jgi:uncharacterized coiled-coil protein SlyX
MPEERFLTPSSIKAMVNAVEYLRKSLKELEDRVSSQENTLELLRTELERQISVDDRISKEIRKLRQDLDGIKAVRGGGSDTVPVSSGTVQIKEANAPVMYGSGFAHITANYLKSLGSK